MEPQRRILVVNITSDSWLSLKDELAAGRCERLRTAIESARAARITAAYATDPAWQRINTLGFRVLAVCARDTVFPAEWKPERDLPTWSALSMCETLFRQVAPDFTYVRADDSVTGDELETWLERMQTLLGEQGRTYAYTGDIALDGDAIARLLDEGDGLSDEDAAELRERLTGLGYL